MNVDLNGIYTALVTPVNKGAIDRKGMDRLVGHVIEKGSKGVVVLGGTGEYCALSENQRADAVTAAIESSKGKVPVVVGILSPGLEDSISMGIESKKMGADAVMLVTPYYVVAKQEGIKEYFLRFMEKVDLPLILYNIPYRTMVNMLPQTVSDLIKEAPGRVIGIKECVPNVNQAFELMNLVGDSISVLCGEEPLFVTETGYGAKGAILATSNLFPEIWVAMFEYLKNGNFEKAKTIHRKMIPSLKLLFAETNPGPLKAALKYKGLDCGPSLLPLTEPNEALQKNLFQELDKLDAWAASNL